MEFRIWIEARRTGRVLDRRWWHTWRESTGIGPEEIGLTWTKGMRCSAKCRPASFIGRLNIASRSAEIRSVWAQTAHQGSAEAQTANDIRRSSSILPSLFPQPMLRLRQLAQNRRKPPTAALEGRELPPRGLTLDRNGLATAEKESDEPDKGQD